MRLLTPFIVVVLVLVAAVSWDRTPHDADLVFVNRGEVFTLDPQRMSYTQDFRLAYALYEGLLRNNNVDLSIEPAAAGLPEVSADRRVYTFRMRPDAQWSNGDPVTAHDFVYSCRRLIMPDTAADYSNLLFDIEGAEEFFRWRSEQLVEYARGIEASRHQGIKGEPLVRYEAAVDHFHQTVGIRAIDDHTLQITLRRPVAYFLDLLSFAVACPVHRPTVEGWPDAAKLINAERGWIGVPEPAWSQREFVRLDPNTGRLEQKHEWARPGRLVSNGPYVLDEWRYKRDMRLTVNPHYHSPQIIKSQSVLMLSIEDPNTAVLAFESGKIDWLADVAAEYAADMLAQRDAYIARYQQRIDDLRLTIGDWSRSAPSQSSIVDHQSSIEEILAALPSPGPGERRDIHALPTFGTDFFSFNCRERLADGRANPFADSRVRRAFALCIDKQAIVRGATRMNEPVMTTLIPRDAIPRYRSPAGLPFDRERAGHELADAGWVDRNHDGLIENAAGELFPTIDLLWTTNSSRYKWMCLELKSQWEAHLGVRVEMRGADTKFYKEDLKLGKFMIARGRWYGDYGDPTTFLDINRTGNGNNDRAFSDARFDAMLDDAAREIDPDIRLRVLEDAERYLVEEQLPLIPICQLVQVYMYEPGAKGLRGLTPHPRLIQYLWQLDTRGESSR